MTQLQIEREGGAGVSSAPNSATLPEQTGTRLSLTLHQQLLQRQQETGCACPIHEGMTKAELIELGAGCTAGNRFRGGWVCPTLDWVRRRV